MIAIENLTLKSETYNESCAYIVLKSLKKSDKQIARFALKNKALFRVSIDISCRASI